MRRLHLIIKQRGLFTFKKKKPPFMATNSSLISHQPSIKTVKLFTCVLGDPSRSVCKTSSLVVVQFATWFSWIQSLSSCCPFTSRSSWDLPASSLGSATARTSWLAVVLGGLRVSPDVSSRRSFFLLRWHSSEGKENFFFGRRLSSGLAPSTPCKWVFPWLDIYWPFNFSKW